MSRNAIQSLTIQVGACAAAIMVGRHAPAGVDLPFRFVPCDDCGLGNYAPAPGMGSGVAAADVDDDGDIDLFVPMAQGTPDALYLNQGDGTFVDVAARAGVATTEQSRTALFFDADGDGRLDLLVANDRAESPTTYRLYRQRDDVALAFDDVTEAAGLFQPMSAPIEPIGRHRGGLTAADVDGDGDLDLLSAMWNGYPQLFLNDGAGHFTDVTAAAGITTFVPFSHQIMVHDFTGDGRPDLYIAVDYRFNALYVNHGDGTFTDIAGQVGADNAWNDMGLALGDYDRDGDFDLFITNITDVGVHNVLYEIGRAAGQPTFTDVSEELGIAAGGWGWGVTFLDADADGWLDIAATNGWTGMWADDPSRLWWNRGPGADGRIDFDDAATPSGFDDTDWGSALIAADLDRDGAVDLVQTCMDGILRVLRNVPGDGGVPGRGVVVRPRMPDAVNHRAIGAEVAIRVGTVVQRRLITAGTSYLGQEPAEAHFGLGLGNLVHRIDVRWPDGTHTVRDLVPALDPMITVERDAATLVTEPADIDRDGSVGAGDLMLLLEGWGPCGALCDGDVVMDGRTDFADLLAVLMAWGD